jgi:transcriptional regulator of acetoin/glycerol metabolism
VAQGLASESLKEGTWDSKTFPALDQFFKDYWYEEYLRSPYQLLISKLREAISNAGTQLVGKTRTSGKAAAQVLFMFREIVGREKKDPGKYYNQVLDEFYRQEKAAAREVVAADKRNFTQNVRLIVADSLLRLAAAEYPISSEPEPQVIRPIRRAELEARITSALDDAVEASAPVVLWGESGNGKSVVARQMMTKLGRTAVLRSGGGEQSAFAQDLIDLLRMLGELPEASTDGRLAQLRTDLPTLFRTVSVW